MKKFITFITVLSTLVLWGCFDGISDDTAIYDETEIESEEIYVESRDGVVSPLLSVSFDHHPSAEEIEEAYQSHVLNVKLLNPGSSQAPQRGQKRITIIAKTANVKYAGTDKSYCFFRGEWLGDNLTSCSIDFKLGVPGRDDLDKGHTDVFFYLGKENIAIMGIRKFINHAKYIICKGIN